MQTPVNPISANYSFTVTTNGNVHTITYKKSKYGIGIIPPILFPSILLSLLFVLMNNGDLTVWIIMSIVFCVGTFLILNLTRSPDTFSVSEAIIVAKGKQYEVSHISSFFIKAPGGYEQEVPIHTGSTYKFKIGGDRPTQIGMGAAAAVTGAVGIMAQAGGLAMQSSKRGIQKQYQKINYSINFVYGEKNVKLASGLSENTADIMLDKIMILSGSPS